MNTDVINKEFSLMISQRGIHTTLGITSAAVRSMRFHLKNGDNISLDRKLELLQKSGWRQDPRSYSQKDLVAAVKFALNASAKAKDHGAEYLVEKFLKSKK